MNEKLIQHKFAKSCIHTTSDDTGFDGFVQVLYAKHALLVKLRNVATHSIHANIHYMNEKKARDKSFQNFIFE